VSAQQPAAPTLLFNLTLENDTRLPLTQSAVTTPNVDLQLFTTRLAPIAAAEGYAGGAKLT